jgi:uncharacterized caspase-like protein
MSTINRDGTLLALAAIDGTVGIWDVLSRKQLSTFKIFLNKGVPTLAFYPNGKWLVAASSRGDAISIWDVTSGQKIRDINCQPSEQLVASLRRFPDPSGPCGVKGLAVDDSSGSLAAIGNFGARLWKGPDWKRIGLRLEGDVPVGGTTFASNGRFWVWGSSVWDLTLKKELFNLSTHSYSPSFSPDSKWLASAGKGEVALWDMEKGDAAAFIVSAGYDWLAYTPDGLFDGSPGAWGDILWRFGTRLMDVLPVEAFFSDFYYPGLLADIIDGRHPKAPRDLTNVDRRQPAVKLISLDPVNAGPIASRTITLLVDVESAPPDQKYPRPSGARDTRLFRNGSLVKIWHGEANARTQYQITVPIIAGANQFTAYSFNDSNVKSRDAQFTVTGAKSLERKGVAYIIGIGINEYTNSDFDLTYASQDAQAFAEELKQKQSELNAFSRVDVVSLVDKDATKNNILAALHRLGGDRISTNNREVAEPIRHLEPAQPEDAVFVYYAGHGTSANSHFYMIPHDFGYRGKRNELDEKELSAILDRSISDEELRQAFEGIDAGTLVMVIDACNSGQALEAAEKRRGPMNSRGLAQLAYEKGMYILAASEGYQEALEVTQLGHGLLTYILVEEGLKTDAPDIEPNDGIVSVREWLDYAARRVPEMQQALTSQTRRLKHGDAPPGGEQSIRRDLELAVQHPRVFYRRERRTQPAIITKLPWHPPLELPGNGRP